MPFRITALCVLGLATIASAAHAQAVSGPAPGRVFRVRQASWWAADGLPASDVVARDSTFIFRPDSARGWPADGRVPAEIGSGDVGWMPVTLVARPREGIEAVLVSAAEASCDEGYRDPPATPLAALSLALVTPVGPARERDRPLPTMTFAACADTVITTFTRTVERRLADWFPPGGVFAHLNGTVATRWITDPHLVVGSAVGRGSLTGWVAGEGRVTADGLLDSLELKGRFRGHYTYHEQTGRVDTIYGTWVVELTGAWIEDPEIRRKRAFDCFLAHGWDACGGEPPDEDEWPPNPFLAFADSAESDSTVLDTLIARRARSASPKERARLEEAIQQVQSWVPETTLVRKLLASPIRVTPEALVLELRYRSDPGDTMPWGTDVAAFLVRELAPLEVQRRRLTSREDLGAHVLSMLGNGHGFVPKAGSLLADGARNADDPVSRDLLLFAAYQADPARYRDLVLSTVDSVRGYGPIVRAWVNGNGDLVNWSWGVESGYLARRGPPMPFPGMDATAERLHEYYVNSGGHGIRRLAPLAMWFRAQGRDLAAELRGRFGADTTYAVRKALTLFDDALGDTTAIPWLRSLLSGTPDARELAHRYVPRDTVRDTTVIAEIQGMLLGYIAGMVSVPNTSGVPVDAPWVHDERPDIRILASEGIVASAIEPWRRHYMVMTMDSVHARVAADGLQMAWTVSPLLRTGDRYYVSVTLSPVGQACLCGGGVRFALERRDGRWVAVSMESWIS
ncbi:MAG TPA: hypothetical protein VGA02_00155 [Gemmatimonadales bacterium]